MSQDLKMNEGNATTAPVAAVHLLNQRPATAAVAPNHESNKKMIIDKKKAMSILAHRKMLLERMKLCRKASEARIVLYEKEGTYSPSSPESAQNGKYAIASRKRKFPSLDVELRTYAELSKYAINYTVKKAPIKAAAPAPRNISLRTGSSVGNKMKAAVATLRTNVGWISDASSSASSQPANRNVSIPQMTPSAANAQSKMKNVPGIAPASGAPLHQPIYPINEEKSATLPAAAADVALSMAMPAPKPNIKKISLASAGTHLKKKSFQSGKKRIGKNVRSGSSMSTSEAPPMVNKPLHLLGPNKTTHASQREHNGNKRILCPETDRLRKKRRDLVMKLENLMRRTYADTMAKEELLAGQIPKRAQFDENPYSNKKKVPWKSFLTADSAPCLLPGKKKTQWDYVLEEMRWLATDYIEENKWKRATAKTLSSAVMTYHTEAAAANAKISPSQLSRSTPSSERSIDEKLAEEVSVEIESSRDDESMEEDSDSDSLPDEHISTLEFVDPTKEDMKESKVCSSTINEMVEAHWKLHSSVVGPLDHNNGYIRYRNLRSNEKANVQKDGDETSLDTSTEKVNGVCTQIQQLSFNEIEERVKKCWVKTISTKSKMADSFDDFRGDISAALEGTTLEIQEDQMAALQFTEALWDNENEMLMTGSVISGPIGCGKTFSTGLLMWRRKRKGPQLLLCPPASLMRWRHELQHFENLNVAIFDANKSPGKLSQVEMITATVILCDFAGAATLLSEIRGIHESFATVVVDSRCSSFPCSSSDNTSTSSGAHPKQRRQGNVQGKSDFGELVAKELYSSEWWNRLIEIAIRKGTRCALVETSCVSTHYPFLEENGASSIEGKEKTDIFASKVAFLYHNLFQSKHKTNCRRAFWWAKKQYIVSKKDNESSSQKIFCCSNGAKGILLQLIKAVSYFQELTSEEAAVLATSCIPKWAVQTCTLSSTQRSAYDRECLFVKGSFQHDKDNLDGGINSAKALLRLRRVCFHSHMHGMVSHDAVSPLSTNHVARRQAGMSASQPNIAKAKSLIEGSSKLRQLLSILCKDCGFIVPAKSYLLGTKPTKRGRKSSAAKRKKVLVLASLPEVLLLISSFLNALGIAHEFLTSPPSHTLLPSRHGIDDMLSTDYTLSWIQCQQSLARFDDDLSDDSPKLSINVLVSSPNTLASTSLGLSASNAEVVISMDEDWSGGFDLSTFSILRKNLTHNSLKVAGRKYIKIISEDTCEESFLTYEKKTRGKNSIQAIPLSMSSLYQTRVDFRQGVLRSTHPTAGKKLLRFARVPLYKVFCTDILRSGTLFGGPLLFLAPASPYFEDKDPCDPPQSWDKVSVFLDVQADVESPVKNSKNEKIISSFGLAMVQIEQSSALTSSLPLLPRQVLDPYNERLDKSEAWSNCKCHDACSKYIHRYMSSTISSLSVFETLDVNNGIIPKKGAGVNGQKEKPTKKRKNGASSVSSSEHSLFRAFSNSKPEETASSLIWYNCLPEDKLHLKAHEKCSSILSGTKDHRTNSYVRSYMCVKKQFDGNQGCESLVYFPPLFPGLLETRHSDEGNLSRLEQSLVSRDLGLLTDTKKRKIALEVNSSSSKKLRGLFLSTSVTDFSAGIASVTPSQPLPNLPGDFNLMGVSDVDFMDGAGDLFDGVDGDFLSDLNITKDEEVIAGDLENVEPETDEVEDFTKSSLDEDFGILGRGLLPPLEESSRAAGKRYGQSNSYSYWLDPFEPLSLSADSYLKGPTLGSVILYVKKSAVPRGKPIQTQPLAHSISPKPFLRSPAGMKAISNGGVHSQLLKKKKKGGSNTAALTAFVAPSIDPTNNVGSLPSMPSGLMSKDPNSRPLRDPSAVFDSGNHRGEPSLQVHHHLQNIVYPSRDPMFESLEKQNLMVSAQCSIRELLPGESTGDAAKSLAKEQSTSFFSEDLVSDGVYFGPFSTSISLKASVCDVGTSIKIKAGIKLPMGVKVPKTMGVINSKTDEWSPTEDEILKECAAKFYRNWHAVSQALTHKSRISSCQDTANVMNPVRSAKHCKNRWDKLYEQTSSLDESNKKDAVDVEGDKEEISNTFTEQTCNGILLDPRSLKDANHLPSINSNGNRRVLHRSKKLNNARTKTHFVPLTIPGYTTGVNMPPLQIVASHHSHSQSVQDAIAVSARPSGIVPPRAEMWPLQFLDLTEKQLLEVEKKKKAASGGQPQVHTSQQGTAMRTTQLMSRQVVPNPAPQRIPPRPPPSGHIAVSGQRQPPPSIPRVVQQPPQATTYSRPMPTGPPHNPPSNTNNNR